VSFQIITDLSLDPEIKTFESSFSFCGFPVAIEVMRSLCPTKTPPSENSGLLSSFLYASIGMRYEVYFDFIEIL